MVTNQQNLSRPSALAFVRAVLAGSLVAAAILWLLIAAAASSGLWNPAGFPELMLILIVAGALALGIVVSATLVLGAPLAIALRRFRLESSASYVLGGAGAGILLLGAATAAGSFPMSAALLGAFPGAATGYCWWRSISPRMIARDPGDFSASRSPRRPIRTYTTRHWRLDASGAGDAKISPLALVMTLGVFGFAWVVAAAGAGRLDWLPPQQYFAPELWNVAAADCGEAGTALTDFEANWYSTHLRAAGEPSLYLASRATTRDATSYRFTWLRSFHAPVVVRVDELVGGEMRLTAKKLSGHGGYNPGRVEARLERSLSADEAAELRRVLSVDKVIDLAPYGCRGGTDGARWILEVNDRGSYHYVNRWTPTDGGVRDVGLLLLRFTGWRLDPVY